MSSEHTQASRPCIIIPGIGQSKVIEIDQNGKKIRNLWPFDADMAALIKRVAAPAARMMLLRRDCGFSSALESAVRGLLEPLSCNADSSRKVSAQVVSYPYPVSKCSADDKRYIYKMVPLNELADSIGEDKLYFFAYDIFGRAEENARLLREFIALVKEQTASEKVNLIPVSMGATVAELYLDLYGGDCDVSRVVGVVPAYNGSDIVSDFMSGNVRTDNCSDLLEMLLSRKEAEKIGRIFAKMPAKVADAAVRKLIRGAAETVIVNCSSMWGLIPSDKYSALRDKYLVNSEHDELRAATDLHWRVRKNLKGLVEREQARSVEFYNICGCGKRLIPISASSDITSDTIVPTYSASMGAHCAAPGKTLHDRRNSPKDFLSPRGDINASSAAAPDRTWFFYGMEHEQAAENRALLSLVKIIITSEEPIDVFTLPDYPQFMEYKK
ncbi:MAG: esterase/lipase family protein, partial [Acutalibacteraceae bacterium]